MSRIKNCISLLLLQFIFVTSIMFNTEITYNGNAYPKWSVYLGWSTCMLSISCIPIYAIYKVSMQKGSFLERIRKLIKPVDWMPSQLEDRIAWEEHILKH